MRLGDDRVRGVATTRYRVGIDLEEVAKDASADMRRRLEEAFESGESRVFEVEVWLDRDGVIRRTRTENRVGDGDAPTIVSTTDYFDFGVAVDVEIPAADRVRPVSRD